MTRAWARLRQHWVRHLLAALQVAVGVAAVTAVVIDVVPVLRSAASRREAGVYSVAFGRTSQWSSSYSPIFDAADAERIQRDVEAVAAASVFDHSGTVVIRLDGDLFAVRGMAKVSPGIEEVAGLRLTRGRFFVPEDAAPAEPGVAVISADLAETLFPGGDPIGREINLRPSDELNRLLGYSSPSPSPAGTELPGLDLRIVGVFEYPEGAQGYSGLFFDTPRTEILVPATGWVWPSVTPPRIRAGASGEESAAPGGSLSGPAPAREEKYSHIYFRAREGMGTQAVAGVEAVLAPVADKERASSPSYALLIRPVSGGSLVLARLQGAVIVGAMGMAALIVSGFSIFTTFLAGIAERVRDIGIARALGATRLRIVREIAGEAVLLAAAGGAIGVLLAFPVRKYVMQGVAGLTASGARPLDAAVAACAGLLLAVGIGALASLYPAWTAARLLPAEALREE